MMDRDERLRILQEAREMVMSVRRDVAEARDAPAQASIHLRMVTNELHRAREELGMYEEHGMCGWKEVERAKAGER